LAEAVEGVDALIVRVGLRVTRQVLDNTDRLKAVASATTGLDHIDLRAAEDRGVAVVSLQGETEFLGSIPASAEHTWSLLLSLSRRVPWAFDDVRQGGWDRDRFRGRDLRGMPLGIVGLGRVGKKVARFGLAFEMPVLAYDPYVDDGWVEGVERCDALDDLLSKSRVLSLHVPLNDETSSLIDEPRLRLLPRGAWIVNTSRGAIIDENALVRLLRENHLAGAAIDVLCEEQPAERREQSPIVQYVQQHENLLLTPHLAGATFESMQQTEVFIAEKLRRLLTSDSDEAHPSEDVAVTRAIGSSK
jgi:D-3-phosphoglycerate dehydrogenase